MLPEVSDSVVITSVGDELLVYDARTQEAHCLNQAGMLVFQACRSRETVETITASLRNLGVNEAEVVLEETLALLAEKKLLLQAATTKFDRRRFLAAAGVAASIPVVASILAPQPAHAVSCVDCEVNGALQPLTCATCGNNCPTGCVAALSRCCFEYRVNQNNPEGAGACNGASGGTGGPEGIGIYSCREIPAGRFFDNNCDTARQLTINDAGSLAAANTRLYYCCICAGANPIFTC